MIVVQLHKNIAITERKKFKNTDFCPHTGGVACDSYFRGLGFNVFTGRAYLQHAQFWRTGP